MHLKVIADIDYVAKFQSSKYDAKGEVD